MLRPGVFFAYAYVSSISPLMNKKTPALVNIYLFFAGVVYLYTPGTVQRRQEGPEPSPRQDFFVQGIRNQGFVMICPTKNDSLNKNKILEKLSLIKV